VFHCEREFKEGEIVGILFHGSMETFSEKDYIKTAKNVFKTLKDLLMFEGGYYRTRKEQIEKFAETFPSLLSPEQIQLLRNLTEARLIPCEKHGDDRADLLELCQIQEAVYAQFLKAIKKRLKVVFLKE